MRAESFWLFRRTLEAHRAASAKETTTKYLTMLREEGEPREYFSAGPLEAKKKSNWWKRLPQRWQRDHRTEAQVARTHVWTLATKHTNSSSGDTLYRCGRTNCAVAKQLGAREEAAHNTNDGELHEVHSSRRWAFRWQQIASDMDSWQSRKWYDKEQRYVYGRQGSSSSIHVVFLSRRN